MDGKIKALLGILTALQVFIFIFGGLYVGQLSEKIMTYIITYQAKKEDLLTQQQRMEMLILQLNSTLNYEKLRNQKLAKESGALNLAPPAYEPQPSQPFVTAQPQPSPPPRVTRAS